MLASLGLSLRRMNGLSGYAMIFMMGFPGRIDKWQDFEKILMDMVKEITKKTETNTDCLEDHARRIKALEDRNRKEDDKKDETRSIVKRVLIGSALGNGGVLAGVWLWVKAHVS